MVNKVTATLFQRYTTVDDFADADPRAFQKAIRPTGFFRNKTRNIIAAAGMIRDEFQGRIPNRMEDILRLPGVARKTANIVLGNAYGVVEGIAVDTHVLRLAPRLGLSRNTLPDKVEKDLMSLVPRTDWFVFSYLLIDHGRKTCKAQRPRCPECVLFDICPSAARSVKVLRKKR
jgi:endonuclease-3